MNNDLQKANFMRRFSAWLFDVILLACLVVSIALGSSAILGYDGQFDQLNEIYESYEKEYGVSFSMTSEQYDEYEKLPEAEKKEYDERYQAAVKALEDDSRASRTYSKLINLTMIIASGSFLLSYLALEFVVPLLLHNGQTVGKKIFGIALMRVDGVKVTPFMLFVRTILGKYTVETMLPVLLLILLFFGGGGLLAITIIGLILLTQVILLIATRTNSALHDMMACTVVVDAASQRIFESPEARMEYIKRVSAEAARKAEY